MCSSDLQTVPVTALRKLSERQVVSAQRADDAYWGMDVSWAPNGIDTSRVAYWVNPSGRLKEAPRGMMQTSGPAALRADREFAARIRDLAKIVDMPPAAARELYNNSKMLATKSEIFGYADELLTKSQMMIAEKHIPQIARLNVEQQKIFKSIFDKLNLETTKNRGQIIQEASSHNYTLRVDNKKEIGRAHV